MLILTEAFDDEPISPVPSGIIEFSGMEQVAEMERLKEQAIAAAGDQVADSPPAPGAEKRNTVNSDNCLLKQYMGVLHGASGEDESITSEDVSRDRSKSAHETILSQGRSKSLGQGVSQDYILNQSMSDMSVGTRSTRQSRREAVMVAQRIDFLQDSPDEMTYTRRIGLYLMKRYKWYYPRLGKEPEAIEEDESTYLGGAYRTPDGYPMKKTKKENPSLEAAWAYFEHFTLTRYVYEPKLLEEKDLCTRITRKFQKGNKELERAERNENILPTKLYDPIWTPQ
jgi:hypothetical protein